MAVSLGLSTLETFLLILGNRKSKTYFTRFGVYNIFLFDCMARLNLSMHFSVSQLTLLYIWLLVFFVARGSHYSEFFGHVVFFLLEMHVGLFSEFLLLLCISLLKINTALRNVASHNIHYRL